MLNRSVSGMPADCVFSETERQLLDHLVPDRQVDRTAKKSLSFYITKLAKLGGYLARAGDSPPGNTVMWRGLEHFHLLCSVFGAKKEALAIGGGNRVKGGFSRLQQCLFRARSVAA